MLIQLQFTYRLNLFIDSRKSQLCNHPCIGQFRSFGPLFSLQWVFPIAIQRELDIPSGDIHLVILKVLVSALARPIRTRFLLQETSISALPVGKLARQNLPLLTKSITPAIRQRNVLYKAHKRTKSSSMHQKYRAARNRVIAMLRLNKTNYFRKLKSCNSKDFWRSKLKDYSIPTSLSNGSEVSNNREKASLLNNFFHSCFNTKSPLTVTPWNLPPSDCPPELFCNEADVYDLIIGLDPDKSTGPDGISARILKGIVDA